MLDQRLSVFNFELREAYEKHVMQNQKKIEEDVGFERLELVDSVMQNFPIISLQYIKTISFSH